VGLDRRPQIRFEHHVGAASAPLAAGYRPRKPERTILYRTVQEHLETMLAEARTRSAHGFGYPRHVERAFRRLLGCGQIARGFVRLRCRDCGHERLLAFSCKSRLCPSCHARRMHDTAFHLERNVLPRVPYRQWVLALPRPVRLLLARDSALLAQVHAIFVRTLFAWQRRAAKRDGFSRVLPGAITFVQHFGSALNPNIHFHGLVPDGVFVDEGPERALFFLDLMGPTPAEVAALTRKLARKITRHVDAYREAHGLDTDTASSDEDEALDHARARALQLPLGSRSEGTAASPPLREPYRCAHVDWFSLHADVDLAAHDREGLLRLVRYGARQSFSQQNLSQLPDGRLRYALKRPFGPQRVRELVLSPTELLHRLAALLPKPYLNLTRYAGVFAPNANRRWEVVPVTGSRRRSRAREPLAPHLVPPPPSDNVEPDPDDDAPRTVTRIPWAELIRLTFRADVTRCARCITGTVAVVAFITDPAVVRQILTHLRLPTELPPVRPARCDPALDFDFVDDDPGDLPVWHRDAHPGEQAAPRGRGPP
jgi:hypothetical protein